MIVRRSIGLAPAVMSESRSNFFTLPYLPGSGEGALTLSSHFGDRPVALVFGSYT